MCGEGFDRVEFGKRDPLLSRKTKDKEGLIFGIHLWPALAGTRIGLTFGMSHFKSELFPDWGSVLDYLRERR